MHFTISDIYIKLGEYKKSTDIYERVYELRCKILGAEHPDTLKALDNLAYTYFYIGNLTKAAKCFGILHDIRCKILEKRTQKNERCFRQMGILYGILKLKRENLAHGVRFSLNSISWNLCKISLAVLIRLSVSKNFERRASGGGHCPRYASSCLPRKEAAVWISLASVS
ncbi:MAG: tetratricopeptide repeat protein [Clostridia bacterium]|nr:tetratricopeptide repeat protein [Clostridia bacterium]